MNSLDPTFGRTEVSPTPFAACGWTGVIAGGLLAAATGPLDLEHGSWAAAFLVLVVGVAQIWLARMQAALATTSARRHIVELVAWNSGCIAVLAGTLIGQPLVVDLGGAALFVALVAFIGAIRRAPAGLLRLAFLLACTIVMVSIPIGLTLGHLRNS